MTTRMRKGNTPLKTEEKKLLFILEESIPKDQTGRKKYVADIAFFYASIFKSKLQHFIGLQLEELAKIGRAEKENDLFRSNINCFRLIDTWMEKMHNEHVGNVQVIRNSLDDDKQFINKIKETYNEN